MSFNSDNFPDLPDSWSALEAAGSYHVVSVTEKVQARDYLIAGALAVVDQGASLIGGYTNDMRMAVQTELPVIVFGDHTRVLKYIDFPFAAGADGIKVLRPRESFEPRLLYYFLSAVRLPNKGYARHFQHLRSSRVPLPPLPEQRRIADALDALLARVDACRERLDRVPEVLKRFRRAVLAAATSGELTREWREEQGWTDEWTSTELAAVANGFSYGTSAKSSRSGKTPVLRMGNIQDGRLDWTDLVFTSNTAEIEKYKLECGDVLFNRTNSPELVGKTAVYHGEHEAIYAGYLIRIRCSEELVPDYLNYCLNSPLGKEYCRQVKSDGVSQSNINATKLAAFSFQLPGVTEQHEIVRRVEELFAMADRLEARYEAARAAVERLAPAALAKAFRGEM